MSRKRWSPVLVAVTLLAACFHQVVQTGRKPGPVVVQQEWVKTWIFGLIAADPIDVRRQCPSGVATVETQQSFPNTLVGMVTIGIFTPQTVKITCAAAGSSPSPSPDALEVLIPKSATREQGLELVNGAIRTSFSTHKTVVLRF
jgi:hypothetical protein